MNGADSVVQSWIDAAATNRGTDRFQVSLAAFRALLDGTMPSIDDLARSTGMPSSDVRQIVTRLHDAGCLSIDSASGAITGAGGLSMVESRHTLDMRGRRYWVWCALDAVGIPAALGEDAVVSSMTADSGEAVRVVIERGEFRHSSPDELVIALVPPSLDSSLHDSCCSRIGFYHDANSTSGDATVLSISETMSLGARLWRDGVPL